MLPLQDDMRDLTAISILWLVGLESRRLDVYSDIIYTPVKLVRSVSLGVFAIVCSEVNK